MNLSTSATPCRTLSGAPNFRDMGGALSRDGGRLRDGHLYRSEGLAFLTDTDLEALERLGIRLVCDLRSEKERVARPSRWPTGTEPEWMLLNILVDLRAGNAQLIEMLRRNQTPEGARQLMVETYRMLPAALAPGLGRLFTRLAEGGAPALVHCTAGKDRTGVVCASILHALGVHRDDIYADYLLSGEYIDKVALAHHSRELFESVFGTSADPEVLDALIGVAPEYLDAAFASIEQDFGSFENYLQRGAGVAPSVLQGVRAQLLG